MRIQRQWSERDMPGGPWHFCRLSHILFAAALEAQPGLDEKVRVHMRRNGSELRRGPAGTVQRRPQRRDAICRWGDQQGRRTDNLDAPIGVGEHAPDQALHLVAARGHRLAQLFEDRGHVIVMQVEQDEIGRDRRRPGLEQRIELFEAEGNDCLPENGATELPG